MVLKKNEKKHYDPFGEDTGSVKDLIEEKRKEIKELEIQWRRLPKLDFTEDEEESERDRVKRKIKRLEKEIKTLQRKL